MMVSNWSKEIQGSTELLLGWLILLVVTFAGAASSGWPWPLDNLELVGRVGGQCKSVTLNGDTAYVGIGMWVVALDVSAPHPNRLNWAIF